MFVACSQADTDGANLVTVSPAGTFPFRVLTVSVADDVVIAATRPELTPIELRYEAGCVLVRLQESADGPWMTAVLPPGSIWDDSVRVLTVADGFGSDLRATIRMSTGVSRATAVVSPVDDFDVIQENRGNDTCPSSGLYIRYIAPAE